MLRSFLPLAKLFTPTLPKHLANFPASCFFATAKPAQKGAATPASPPKSKYKPAFPIPPPMEPMEEGEGQDQMEIDPRAYLNLVGQKLYQNRRSAYAAVERRGKVYHLFDAERVSFGKMCQSIAKFIQGKHTPLYRPERVGNGDICVVVNADKMKFTGKKAFQKSIKYHTGYVGNLKEIPYKRMILEKPEQLICRTVYKFLPKNKLRLEFLKNIHIFRGPTHPLTNYLPNFGFIPEDFEYVNEPLKLENYKPEDTIVSFETEDGGPAEFKDYKREIDTSIIAGVPPKKFKIPRSEKNRQLLKDLKKYQKLVKRYKIHKVKPPKYHDILKEAEEGSVFIDRDWKNKKLGLENAEDIEVPEED